MPVGLDEVDSIKPVQVWGVPLMPYTFAQALDQFDRLIQSGQPHYVITANVHYAMLTEKHNLEALNQGAAFILADGMPLVWASRWRQRRLPERVAGSDLIWALCTRAAERGYRVFLLGGAPGVGEEAAKRLRDRFPSLQVVGIECPPFRPLTPEEQAEMIGRIRQARPDLLFVAFGQPKGEQWIAEHLAELSVPVCMQVGASLDFVAGRVPRAPRLIQRIGLEWAYRLYREPRRLLLRYVANAWFVFRRVVRDVFQWQGDR